MPCCGFVLKNYQSRYHWATSDARYYPYDMDSSSVPVFTYEPVPLPDFYKASFLSEVKCSFVSKGLQLAQLIPQDGRINLAFNLRWRLELDESLWECSHHSLQISTIILLKSRPVGNTSLRNNKRKNYAILKISSLISGLLTLTLKAFTVLVNFRFGT